MRLAFFYKCCFFSLFFSSFSLQAQVTVVASGGATGTNYTTVNEAFAAINSGTHTGSIELQLSASTSEPANPTALLASGQGSSNYSAILIKPTAAGIVINGDAGMSERGVLELDGADNVTIDGRINPGSTTRDLTIQSNSANTVGSACIRLLGRTSAGLGAENNRIEYCTLIGSSSGLGAAVGATTDRTYGIYAAGTGTSLTATSSGVDYDRNTIRNNVIKRAYTGISIRGGTGAQANQSCVISDNIIGDSQASDAIGAFGIRLLQMDVAAIENNQVFNISNEGNRVTGIEVGGSSSIEVAIAKNMIYDLAYTGAGTDAAFGINITNGTTHFIHNNVVHSLEGSNNSSTTATTQHVAGIRISGGNAHSLFHNSIYLSPSFQSGSTLRGAAYALILSGSYTGLDVRNNIFANTATTNATDAEFAGIWFTTAGFDFTSSTFDNNAYWLGNSPQHMVAKLGTTSSTGQQITMADFRAASASEANGVPTGSAANAGAFFPSSSNLRLADGTSNEIESAGVLIPFFTTDILGLSRPAFGNLAPDIGAYEFNGINPNFCNLSITSTLSNPVCAGEFGSVSIDTIPGGAAPFSYAWSDGQSLAQATGLGAGSYSVTVSDNNNCTISENFTISAPTGLSLSASEIAPLCEGGSDGAINLSASGGTAPLSYLWSDGETSQSRSNLTAGSYTLTLSDANGCSLSETYTISDGASFSLSLQSSPDSCFATSSVSLSLNNQGAGTNPSFAWSDNATSQDRNGLASGTYSVTATDNLGCTATGDITISNDPLSGSLIDSTEASCATCPDGSLEASGSGGLAPLSYLWSDGQTTAAATGLAPGSYTLTISDATGCELSFSGQVHFPTNLRTNSNLLDIELFPNPASTHVYIRGLGEGQHRLRLFNALGQMLSEQEIQSDLFEFDCSQLPQGSYYWHISSEQGQKTSIWIKS